MAEIELSEVALEHLKRLAAGPATVPDLPELKVLWDNRLIMGSRERCHITQKGKSIVMRLV